LVQIETAACKGCGICVYACPLKILTMSDNLNSRGVHYPAVIEGQGERCIKCGNCMIHCPDFAIFLPAVSQNENAG